jgi:magnesium transporter
VSAPTEIPQSEVENALADRDFSRLRRLMADHEIRDVASAIGQLELGDRAVVFRVLPREQAADAFEYLETEVQEELIKALAHEQVADILNSMSPDDRTSLLEELPAAVTKQMLALLSPEERVIARRLLGYPEDSVGRLMTPDFIAVRPDWTVQQALDHVRRHGEDSETLNVIYVVDERGILIDDLRMRQLLLTEPETTIDTLSSESFVALKATDDQETAVRVFREYDRVAFPVTDSRGVLLGIVTVDDVLDVAEEEATEDIQKLGGSTALEQPYMNIGFVNMSRKRMGWLVILFMGQLLTLEALRGFIGHLEQNIALVLFVPLIISSGGNSGSQAATLVIRAIALDEVVLRDWWRVLLREVMFGVLLGLTLAVVGFLRVAMGGVGEFGMNWTRLGLAMSVSVIFVVLWGILIGSMLPFILRRLGFDPATSSTPFVATIVDVTGLIIYLATATWIL